jgi:hypothetical protein
VQLSYIDRRIAGMRGDAAMDAKHARLAGAMLLDMVVCDASCVHTLESAWGQPNGLTKAGEAHRPSSLGAASIYYHSGGYVCVI